MTRLSDAVVGRLRQVATWPDLPPDRYAIARVLGRGGMGTVYAAYDALLDRDVALKVSNALSAAGDLDHRLRTEARVLARLEHPGIVPVHDAGSLADGRLFYVMKLVQGDTLAEHLPRLEEEAARLGVFERIVETVAFAHAAGVVHRDLKPSNVMVGRFGEVLILDWGVAKVIEQSVRSRSPGPSHPDVSQAPSTPRSADDEMAPGATGAGTRIGTPGFMAPEQHRGDTGAVGPHSDVYALGALLFWMMTGRTPPASPEDASRQLAGVPPVPPARRLRALVAKCLAANPGDRYPDAGALARDLARYRAGLPVSAYRETLLDHAGRWLGRYRTFILLVAAYLVMRTLFAFFWRW